MRALVTGGCGFVGRHLSEALLNVGCDVDVVDPVVPGTGGSFVLPLRQRMNKHFTFYEQDCRKFFVEQKASDWDVVFHLAAVVGGRYMIDHAPLAVGVDLSIDAEMWNWVTSALPNAPHVAYFSSSAAYPVHKQQDGTWQLVEEDLEFSERNEVVGLPDMTYGWAKLTGEYLAHIARTTHGITSTVYRPFSGYGEDQDLTYPIPAICQRETRRKPNEPARVWGPGTQIRDFVHIDDVITAVLQTYPSGKTLNISSGIGTCFIDVARLAARDAHLEVVTERDKPVGVRYRVGDTRMQRSLGVQHAISLEQGLARCVHYWRNRG